MHGRSGVARHAIVALVRCMLRAGKASLSCLDLAPAGLGFLTGCRGPLHFWAGGRSRRLARTNSPAPALKGYGSLDRPASCRRLCSRNGTNSFAGGRALFIRSMPAFLYPLPEHRLQSPGPSQPKMRRTIPRNYQAVTCSVCERVYLVNPATGKVFGEDE